MTTRSSDPEGSRIVLDLPDRLFVVWRYSVSHGQLLLRSVRTEESPTRVDVLLKNVNHMRLPTSLPGLRIEERALEVTDDLPEVVRAETADAKAYWLSGRGYQRCVIASTCESVEDTEDYSAPSRLWPQESGSGWNT